MLYIAGAMVIAPMLILQVVGGIAIYNKVYGKDNKSSPDE